MFCNLGLVVRRDLIYEGITTRKFHSQYSNLPIVRRDLIYEGITTGLMCCNNCGKIKKGQKGPDLRRDYDRKTGLELRTIIKGQKGPDLRRDYDQGWMVRPEFRTTGQKGPDLRRDYDRNGLAC